jgi:atypical dual specificity phosphatase
MWTWSLNWGEVSPHLVVGTCPLAPADVGRIQAGAGVSAVLSLQHDDCLAYWGIDYDTIHNQGSRLGLTMRRCPLRDFDIPNQRERLPHAVAALTRLRSEGHRIYVHCTAGLGRAPLTVLAYLTWVEGQPPECAIRTIHNARRGAVPAWEAYHGCREDLVVRYHTMIERRAYELHEKGGSRTALDNWVDAETGVIRSALMELSLLA